MKILSVHSRLLIICLVILASAMGLRFIYLNSLPVFADEAIYVRWAQVMRSEATLRFLPLSDGKQPLFMWGVIPFLKLISDPLVAGRVFSGLAGLGTMVGVALATQLLFKRLNFSFLAAAIWAVLPYAVFFERMALSDSLLTMFIIWAFNLMYLCFAKLRLDFALLAGFCLGFAWLTKSPAIFALALTPVLIIFLPKYSKRNIFVACGLCLVAWTVAFAMYNILRLGPQFHMIALRNRDYVYPLAEVLKHPTRPLVPHLNNAVNFFLYLLTPFGLVFAAWGIFAGARDHLRSRLVLLVWWLIPVFAQAFVAISFTARYLMFTLPFAVILATHALGHIGDRTKNHRLSYLAAALIIIPGIWFGIKLISSPASVPLPRIERAGYLEEWTAGVGLRQTSEYVRTAANNGPVVVGSEGFFGTPFDALGMYLNDLPQVRVIGVGVWIDTVSDKLTSALSENQVFLVVNSSRFHGQPDQLGLKLIKSFPKAVSPSGSQEHLLFFQVLQKIQ